MEKNKKKGAKQLSLALALSKAQSSKNIKKNKYYIGADTIIEFNGTKINKAKSFAEAKKKIKMLSGKKHIIYSSVAVFYNKKIVWKTSQKTSVFFRKLSNKDISDYLKSCDKSLLSSVGCYQLEKNGPSIIEKIKGDFFNVMGLPLFPLLVFLIKHKSDNIKK